MTIGNPDQVRLLRESAMVTVVGCPKCLGRGRRWYGRCLYCRGHRTVIGMYGLKGLTMRRRRGRG